MSSTLTVREATEAYLRERRRRGEITAYSERGYRARLDSFMVSVGAERDVGRMQRRHIERWMDDAFEALAPPSRRAYFTTARLFCRWLRDKGHVSTDLFAGLAPPREPRQVPRNLDPDAVRRVLGVCDQRERIVVILMLQEALRRGEVARLRVEDVDFSNRLVRVHGKGEHERVVPLAEQAVEELRRWLAAERITSGPVVRSRLHPERGLRPATIGSMLTKAMYRAGVKLCPYDRVSGHSLRHTSIADMLRNGAHIRDVQQVAGHRSISTTELYMPLVVETLEKAVGGRTY